MISADNARPRLTVTVDVTDLSDENRLLFTERVADLYSEYLDSEEKDAASTVLGWTRATLDEAIAELDRDGSWVQAAVIRRALQNGGTVSRDEVYAIGKYDQNRTLRGITRPVNRIVSRMRAKGIVPASAVDLLKPIYEGVQAVGFGVPTELVNIAG